MAPRRTGKLTGAEPSFRPLGCERGRIKINVHDQTKFFIITIEPGSTLAALFRGLCAVGCGGWHRGRGSAQARAARNFGAADRLLKFDQHSTLTLHFEPSTAQPECIVL